MELSWFATLRIHEKIALGRNKMNVDSSLSAGAKSQHSHIWVPLVVIFVVWVSMFVALGFDFGLEGDDIFFISRIWSEDSIQAVRDKSYLEIASSRGFLNWSMVLLYKACSESTAVMQSIFCIGWLCNGWLCFLLLRKYYAWPAALLAGLLFLVYSGKYEVVPVLSAGMYHLVISLFLVALLALTSSKFRFVHKMFLISALLWVSLHFYEVVAPLVVLVPLYGWYLYRKAAITATEVPWSLLPIGVLGVHILVLSNSASPIWNRSGAHGFGHYADALPSVFGWSLNSLLGPRHWEMVLNSWRSLFFMKELGELNTVFLASMLPVIIIVGAVVCLFVFRPSEFGGISKIPARNRPLLLFATYIALIAPLVALPVALGQGFVAPRFTYLPSLGLVIIAAHMMSKKGRFAHFSTFAVSVWIILEAVSMRSILVQYQTSAAYDENIRRELRNFRLDPELGSRFFISLSNNDMFRNVWRQGFSKFEQGGAQSLLLLDFPRLQRRIQDETIPAHERLYYTGSVREKNGADGSTLLKFLSVNNTPSNNGYVFSLRNDGKLCGVSAINFTGAAGELSGSREVSHFPHSPSEICIITLSMPVVGVSDPIIDRDREIYVVHNDARPRTLRLHAELFPTDPPLKAFIAADGKEISKFTLLKKGKYTWDVQVPVNKAGNVSYLQVGILPDPPGRGRKIWKINSLELLP